MIYSTAIMIKNIINIYFRVFNNSLCGAWQFPSPLVFAEGLFYIELFSRERRII